MLLNVDNLDCKLIMLMLHLTVLEINICFEFCLKYVYLMLLDEVAYD